MMVSNRENGWLAAVLVIIVIFAGGIAFTLITAVRQTQDIKAQVVQACVDRKHQYDAVAAVIVEQNKVQVASPIILKAFPEFKKFFTPGTPEYAEAARIADDKRDRALSKLGVRPEC